MSEVSLAKGVVEVVAKGIDDTIKKIDQVQKKSEKAGETFGKMADKFLSFGTKVGIAGGIALGIFGKKAMEGTVEAEKFSLAITRFFRVTGDALAPYVRGATSAINSLTKAFYGFSPSTKDLFVKIALGATAVGVLSGGMIALKAAFSGIMPFVKIFVGMIGTGTALVAGLGAAALAVAGYLGGVFDSGISGSERFSRAIRVVLDAWEGLKAVGRVLYDIFKEPLEAVAAAFSKAFTWIGSLFTGNMVSDANEAGEGIGTAFSGTVEALVGYFNRIREEWTKVTGYMKEAWSEAQDFIAQGLVTTAQKAQGMLKWMNEKKLLGGALGLGGVANKVADALGQFAPKGVGRFLAEDAKQEAEARKAIREKDLADAKAAGAKLMEDLKKRLAANIKNAKEFGKFLLDPLKKAQAAAQGGGFKMKVGIEIGTIQSAFDRIAVAVANASNAGATIEQQQLGEMKGMNDKLGAAVNGINALRNVVPAVGA